MKLNSRLDLSIVPDEYGDGRETITATLNMDGLPAYDATAPTIEHVLLKLIMVLGNTLLTDTQEQDDD